MTEAKDYVEPLTPANAAVLFHRQPDDANARRPVDRL